MLKFKALDHVGVFVTDMDRSLRFYTEDLGLQLLRRRGAGRAGAGASGDYDLFEIVRCRHGERFSHSPQRAP